MKDLEKIEFNTDCAKPMKNLPEKHYCTSYQLCFKEKPHLESYLCCNFCKTNNCPLRCKSDCKDCVYSTEKEWILERCFANHMFDNKPVKTEVKKEKVINQTTNTSTKETKEIPAKEPVKVEEKPVKQVTNKDYVEIDKMRPCELW